MQPVSPTENMANHCHPPRSCWVEIFVRKKRIPILVFLACHACFTDKGMLVRSWKAVSIFSGFSIISKSEVDSTPSIGQHSSSYMRSVSAQLDPIRPMRWEGALGQCLDAPCQSLSNFKVNTILHLRINHCSMGYHSQWKLDIPDVGVLPGKKGTCRKHKVLAVAVKLRSVDMEDDWYQSLFWVEQVGANHY